MYLSVVKSVSPPAFPAQEQQTTVHLVIVFTTITLPTSVAILLVQSISQSMILLVLSSTVFPVILLALLVLFSQQTAPHVLRTFHSITSHVSRIALVDTTLWEEFVNFAPILVPPASPCQPLAHHAQELSIYISQLA